MAFYFVVEIRVEDAEAYAEYVRRVPATVARHGGRYLARGAAVPVWGDWIPERVVVLEFPGRAAFERWERSPEYREIARIREGAAGTRAIAIEGVDVRPPLVPELYVSDLDASLAFYTGPLRFEVAYARPEDRFACLRRGAAHLMLEQTPGRARATPEELARGEWRTADLERPFGRGLNLEIEIPDVDAVHAALRAAGHPCLLEPHERTYRVGAQALTVYQMLVEDPDGYLLRFSERRSLTPAAP